MKKIILITIIALNGCTSSSGVMKSGTDSYSIKATASPGAGGATAAKKLAYTDASQECAKQGKAINILNEFATAPSWTDGMYTVDLIFKCS